MSIKRFFMSSPHDPLKPSRREKVLSISLCSSILLIIALVGFICYLFLDPSILWRVRRTDYFWSAKGKKEICLTPVCVSSASEIMKRIDPKINPCDDFYQFSCGGLDNKHNLIPDDRSGLSVVSVLQQDIDKRIRVLLEEIDPEDEASYLSKMRITYNSCMNTSQQEKLGDEPLILVFEEIGGWPVAEPTWNESDFKLHDVLAQLKKMGYSHDFFAKIDIAPHVLDHKINIIYIGAPELSLEDRSYYVDPNYNKTMDSFQEFLMTSAKEMTTGTINLTFIEEEMNKVLEFERELAKINIPKDPNQSILNYMNLSMIQEEADHMNWTAYLDGAFSPYIYIPNDTWLVVKNPPLFRNVSELIARTEPRVLANYVGIRIIMESTSVLSTKWSLIGRKLWTNIDGRTKLRNRWHYCLGVVKRQFDLGVSSLYVQSLTGRDDKQTSLVKKIVKDIKDAFVHSIRTNQWMDSQTKEEAMNKTRKMNLHIGYPKELLNRTAVDEFYQLVNLKKNYTFFQNNQILRRFRMDKGYNKVLVENTKGHWHEYGRVSEVNAYYRAQENSIEFPLSIVDAMNIHPEKPMFLNFGDIGWVVGHEISHGFDNMGRHFDAEGHYRGWWTNETDAEYEKKTSCFIDQYKTYDVPDSDQEINGNLTLGENLADNGGLKEAYRAYEQYIEENGEEPYLPGVDYTPRQLFFIQSANFYCGKYRKELTEHQLKTDAHSPNMFRVIGTMSNLPEFSRTFNCPAGSKMNPVDKCTLW